MKMSKFEQKFGKYAISNLTFVLIMCYVAGYIIELINPNLIYYLTLDPYQILQGQIWRLVSWILIPPSIISLTAPLSILSAVIMLYFYYNIGTVLERTWGTYRYNVYIFSGMLFTVLASILYTGFVFLVGAEGFEVSVLLMLNSISFSTNYIILTVLIAFAFTYPDMTVYFMLAIPLKMKWLAIIELVMLGMQLFEGALSDKFAIVAALVNLGIFYLRTKSLFHMNPKQMKRRAEFRNEVKRNTKVTRHKCAICGRTEEDDPTLEFRYCSKCNGNYEYCQNHLFTHEHVK